jgi:hypothetical protein
MIEKIRQKVRQNQFEFSQHDLDPTIFRQIAVQELQEAIEQGEVIEDYPDDKYGASCLIGGVTLAGKVLHIHCSYPNRPLIKIITIYEPDPQLWINFKLRRKKNVNGI